MDRRKSVIILGGGDLVFPAYRIAREDLGLSIIAMDLNPRSPGMSYADEAVVVDIKNVTAAAMLAQELTKRHDVVGVFTCGADVEVTVAAIAEALGLPGIPLSVAMDCNDKVRMHKRLDYIGFTAKPKYRVIEDRSQLDSAISHVGMPCIVKPISNCASRGVQRLDDSSFLYEAYELAKTFNVGDDKRVLVEQALDGSKHTVEMIAYQGKTHLLSIIDTHYISPRWPCETGLNTTRLSPEMQSKAFQFATQVATAIGINFGAHKVDINFDRDGKPGLIELTARLSGGFHCQYASPLAYGSNDIRAALKLAVGMPLDMEDIRHRWQKGSAVRAVFPQPGRIKAIQGVEEARKLPGIAEIFVMRKIGDHVGPFRNSADRVAYVIASGSTTDEAILNAERAVNAIRIETTK